MLLVFVAATIFIVSCTKETANVKLPAELATTQVLNLKSDSATVVGFVVAAGSGFTEKGVCYDTVTSPTTSNNKVVYSAQSTTSTFKVTLAGLSYATKYYARAYAIDGTTTLYGTEINFTTLPVLATVVTGHFTATSGIAATGGGTVVISGGADVTARGVCYDTTANPTISSSKTTDGKGLGVFVSSLTKLTGQTTYHVRAYAKNSAGVAYGADSTFTTPVSILTWYIAGDYVTASYPGSTYGDWSPGTCPFIMSTLVAGDKLEGYVNMAKGTNQWKFATKPNWNGPNYADDNSSGVLNPNASNNISSPTGYYKINANATALTYTAVATTWGIIGDATAGGWGNQTDMTYNPTLQVFTIGATLTSGGFLKFRGTSDWNVNYGSTAADGSSLDAGGSNIAVSSTADYAITLDLSHPNVYTYSANSWGVIGDATPGGWSTDSPMTWDAVNKVFTTTIALVGSKQFKFRANQAWTVNFGGKGSGDGAADNYTDAVTAPLAGGGKNLGVPGGADGNYIITLDPWTKVATVTLTVKKK